MLGQHDFSGAVLGGRYHLDRRIGCGAMATIYAATDQTTKGCVAIKVLHPEHDQSADLVRRFTQEGQLAAQIRHPNLVPAHDLGWIGGRHYVVMQLVHGERLPALMQSKPLPWALSVRLVLDLLAGLAALHKRGVAHRDVSPPGRAGRLPGRCLLGGRALVHDAHGQDTPRSARGGPAGTAG